MSRRSGVTLLEVIVAAVLLAISFGAVLKVFSGTSSQGKRVELKRDILSVQERFESALYHLTRFVDAAASPLTGCACKGSTYNLAVIPPTDCTTPVAQMRDSFRRLWINFSDSLALSSMHLYWAEPETQYAIPAPAAGDTSPYLSELSERCRTKQTLGSGNAAVDIGTANNLYACFMLLPSGEIPKGSFLDTHAVFAEVSYFFYDFGQNKALDCTAFGNAPAGVRGSQIFYALYSSDRLARAGNRVNRYQGMLYGRVDPASP